jgi:hypothetical protein
MFRKFPIQESNTISRNPRDMLEMFSSLRSLVQCARSPPPVFCQAIVYNHDMNAVELTTISRTGRELARLEIDSRKSAVVMI